jgi:hypothetical protein
MLKVMCFFITHCIRFVRSFFHPPLASFDIPAGVIMQHTYLDNVVLNNGTRPVWPWTESMLLWPVSNFITHSSRFIPPFSIFYPFRVVCCRLVATYFRCLYFFVLPHLVQLKYVSPLANRQVNCFVR